MTVPTSPERHVVHFHSILRDATLSWGSSNISTVSHFYRENSVLRWIQRLPALQAQVLIFRRDQPAEWTYPERSEVPCWWSQLWQEVLQPLSD